MKSISAAGVFGMIRCHASGNATLTMTTFAASLAITALGLVGWWNCLKHDR